MTTDGGLADAHSAPAVKRPLLLKVLCIVSVLAMDVQLIGGAQLVLGLAPSHAARESANADDQEAHRGTGVSLRSKEVDIDISFPDVMVQNERERALAPSTGWATMLCALFSIWGAVWLWRMKRAGLWLFLFAGLLYTAAIWRYEDASTLSGIASIAITGAFTLALTALYAVHWRVLR